MVVSLLPARQFVRNYRIPIIATVLLIILAIFLIFFHQYDLSKVGVIFKANPVISTEGQKLVSQDQATTPAINPTSGGDVTINPSAPALSSSATPSGASDGHSSSSSPGNTSSNQSSGATAQSGTSTGSSFNASIGNITDATSQNCVLSLVLCTTDHTFTGTITTTNGPGTVQYYWERSDGTIGSAEQKSVGTGTSTVTTTYTWTNVSTGWVKLHIITPNQAEKQYSF